MRVIRALPWLETIARDVRYALRTFTRSPAFAATAVLSLALGIGASAGIFSLLDQVLLRQLPVREPERLVQMDWNGTSISANWGSGRLLSYPLCRDLEAQDTLFEGVFCRHPTAVNFSTGGEQDQARAEIVSGSYFPVLGLRPEIGRLIDPSDDRQPDAHPVVVLAAHYWRNTLGGAPDIVGRRVLINNYPMTVIGVAPATFRGLDVGESIDLWIPAMMKRQATPEWNELLDRRAFWMHVFGRLEPGVTAEQARARLQPWFKAMLDADTTREGFPTVSAEQRSRFLASTLEVLPGARGSSDLRAFLERPLWVLMGGTALLLLLASLNVAGLLVARGAARRGELMTRVALGASRARITMQLLVESVLIAAGGGVLGLLAAPVVSRVLLSFVSPDANLTASVDRRVFVFAVLASLVTAVLCGCAPLVLTGRLASIASLWERARSATPGAVRFRKALVVGQIAFAALLLTAAGLFVQTLARLQAKGTGFTTSRLLMFSVDPLSLGYPGPEAAQAMREVLGRVEALPGVERAAVANTQMLNLGTSSTNFTIQADERKVTDRVVHYMRVGPGFFSTLGTALIAGRDFDDRDVRPAGSPPGPYRSIIINEAFARRYFGTVNPIGYRVSFGNRPDAVPNTDIIGVVRDFTRRDLRDEPLEQAFVPFWDRNSTDGAFYVRINGDTDGVSASIRAAVSAVDPRLPVRSMTTFEDQIARSLTTERALATLSSGFGLIALLIAVVGLYGVMAFVAMQRTPEIGVRLALGATRSAAVWLIVRDAVRMVALGTVVALPAAFALRRLVEAELFGVRVLDGPTMLLATGLLGLAALAAALLPAWRAVRLEPSHILRAD
jgi:predicted permease